MVVLIGNNIPENGLRIATEKPHYLLKKIDE
jgi:hypothetical protein